MKHSLFAATLLMAITISFGCGGDAPYDLEIDNPSGVFNIAVRHYQPSKRVLEDDYRLVPFMNKKYKD